MLALVVSLPAVAGWNPAAVRHDLTSGEAVQALQATHARLADQADDPQAQFLQAMALADTGDTSGAVALYRTLSKKYPQRARVWNNLGVLYARQGRLAEARQALSHAVASEPGYATAETNLGDVYVALASDAYRRARQQGADADTMNARRRALARLVPSLPSAAKTDAVASSGSDTSAPHTADSAAKKTTSSSASDQAMDRTIDGVLSRWANAWSDQDVAAYLSVYSNDYQPSGDTTRAQWIRRQRVRVTQPKSVNVRVSDIQVTKDSADRAQATFHEHYQAAGHEREATRHMVFVREDGNWRIRRES
ncbi:tetratricopeptide repeat protein [Salinisphaera hydrothermalis]|uniref:nuclear transport factor 2 family protein n=1 Tax=Salinisphaera hydrothermalis TaxID=563188 RepID=UPI0018DD301A|nr:tetratricopeptide repeat protein [Salinisphaera hydrothermalis]